MRKGMKFIDLGLMAGKTLIIADLHIGYEEALNKQGILVPRFQFDDLYKRVERLLKKSSPDIVVLNGDIKHEFGTISKQEWRDTLKILDLLLKYAKKVVLVRGNHDNIIGPIAEKRGIEISTRYSFEDILVVHGHEGIGLADLPKGINIIVIGHEHPAVSLRDALRSETYKCFLVGRYKSKELIVLPSFNLVTEGTDILREQVLSPFLKNGMNDFEVFVVEDSGKILDFGKVKGFRQS